MCRVWDLIFFSLFSVPTEGIYLIFVSKISYVKIGQQLDWNISNFNLFCLKEQCWCFLFLFLFSYLRFKVKSVNSYTIIFLRLMADLKTSPLLSGNAKEMFFIYWLNGYFPWKWPWSVWSNLTVSRYRYFLSVSPIF